MYNFFVTAQQGAWKKTGYQFERGRFLEYTSDKIATRFQELKTRQINALLRLPCLFAYEGPRAPMRIGKLLKVRPRERSLYIEFSIDPNIRPIPFRKIAPLKAALDIRDWELSRTHWAIKDENLLEILAGGALIPAAPKSLGRVAVALPVVSVPTSPVESVDDFVKSVLNPRERREVFYRGHSDRAKYRLEPSIYRKDERGNFKYADAEDRIYRELLVSNSSDFQGDTYTLDKLVRMQHHSLPTRLLDITSNPLIALYFACKSNLKELGEVIVFKMRRDEVRYFDSDTASCIANLTRVPKTSKDAIDYSRRAIPAFNRQQAVKRLLHFIKEEKPFFEGRINPLDLRSVICVKGKYTSSRISFQSGAFLLFGQDATLDESGTPEIAVERIAVANKVSVLRQLDQLNINESTVFPYIENSAKYIAEKFAFRA
jgi:FRG domain